MTLSEPEADTENGDDDGTFAALVRPIFSDGQLRLFVASRVALAVTALAPPFIVGGIGLVFGGLGSTEAGRHSDLFADLPWPRGAASRPRNTQPSNG